MKSELKAKFIQHLVGKRKEEGFTLIELLVVIIIIGILSAIALPSFLNQANKARQSEARTYVGSLNRSQQAFYLERTEFADNASFGALGLGIPTETENYTYVIADGGPDSTIVTNQAQPDGTDSPVKAYVGGVALGEIAATSEATTLAALCEAELPPGTGGDDGSQTFADVTGDPDTDCAAVGNYIGLN
jgi:prepilin-type N-terminal cleavage/methylation domain-containing protein